MIVELFNIFACARKGAILWAVAAMLASSSFAQTDYSLRIRSLGTNLAGIVEDDLTDLFLNPARLSRFDGRKLRLAYQPSRTVDFSFPVASDLTPLLLTRDYPNEDYFPSFSFSPKLISLMAPLGGGLKSSIAFEVHSSGSESAGGDHDVGIDGYPSRYRLENVSRDRLLRSGTEHYLLDLVLSHPLRSRSFGVRFKSGYDRRKGFQNTSYERVYSAYNDFSETARFMDYDYSRTRYERTFFDLSLGLYSSSKLSDLVGGLRHSRYRAPERVSSIQQDLNDLDGNGQGVEGGSAEYQLSDYLYESFRDYSELEFFARIHFRLGGHIRWVNQVTWKDGAGDGSGLRETEDNVQGSNPFLLRTRTEQDYEGDYARLLLSSAIGCPMAISETMLFSFGVKLSYRYESLDERGEGDVFLDYYDPFNATDTLSSSGDFSQAVDREQRRYYLLLPIAFEWDIADYFRVMLGADVGASHIEDDLDVSREYGLEVYGDMFPEQSGTADHRVSYSTWYDFYNGFEVDLGDKVVIRAFSSYIYKLDFATYGYLSVMYDF